MKKIINILLLIILLLPLYVKANIVCNDGTISNSCQDCHTGCCSGHEGCTENPNNNSYNNYISRQSDKNDVQIINNNYGEDEEDNIWKTNANRAICYFLVGMILSAFLLIWLHSGFNESSRILFEAIMISLGVYFFGTIVIIVFIGDEFFLSTYLATCTITFFCNIINDLK